MFARLVWGVIAAGALSAPALAGQMMTAQEAQRFVYGKVFAFTCFDGTRGAGRVYEDGSAAGSIQFSGSGPMRHVRVPVNTLQVHGQSVCASLKGLPFEPCFNLNKEDDRSFRGSVSGMGFAYCDFHHQGGRSMLMARAVARPRSLHRPSRTRSADATQTEVATRVETPKVESAKLDPVKPAPVAKTEAKPDPAPELRRTTE